MRCLFSWSKWSGWWRIASSSGTPSPIYPLVKLRAEGHFIRAYSEARRALASGSPASGEMVTVAVVEALGAAGIIILGTLLEVTGPDLQEAAEMGACLGWRSRRNMERLPSHWGTCLKGWERQLLREYSQGPTFPCPNHYFPSLII